FGTSSTGVERRCTSGHCKIAFECPIHPLCKKTSGRNRRRFCSAAAATVAAGPRGLPSRIFPERSKAMSTGAQQTGSDQTAMRPFHVNVPEAELTELRRRINATKWPERETVTDM